MRQQPNTLKDPSKKEVSGAIYKIDWGRGGMVINAAEHTVERQAGPSKLGLWNTGALVVSHLRCPRTSTSRGDPHITSPWTSKSWQVPSRLHKESTKKQCTIQIHQPDLNLDGGKY